MIPQPLPLQLLALCQMELTNWRWSWQTIVLTSIVAPILSTIALGNFAIGLGTETLAYILTGNLVMTLMFGNLNNVASRFTYMRFAGTLDYYATLPIARSALVVAVVFSFFLLSLPSLIVTLAFGAIFLKLAIGFNPLILLVLPLCVLPLSGLGALIGTNARSPEAGSSVSLLVTMVMLFLGPVLIPADRLPPILLAIGHLSPATYAASALRQTLVEPMTRTVLIDLAALVGFSFITFYWVRRNLDWRQR